MNFLTVGARLNKAIDKRTKDLMLDDSKEQREIARKIATEMAWQQYEQDVETGLKAYAIFQEKLQAMGMSRTNWYLITIRPPTAVDWNAFLERVKLLITRRCFREWTLSFEQKGTTEDTLGNGFHVHIVASVTQRSKGELLRDISSTMKGLIGSEGIDIEPTRNPGTIIQNYLIDYKSNDGHKELTHEWDTRWRLTMGLKATYTNEDNLP